MKTWLIALLLLIPFSSHCEEDSWTVYKIDTLLHQNEIMGWCTKEKALKLMDLIKDTQPEVCVEIGVFGGSSIYPISSALKFNDKGIVYAIDPWSKEECLIGYNQDDPNYSWWSEINYEGVFQHFLWMLNTFNLHKYCAVMRMKSIDAATRFPDDFIDILHVDGNHTEEAAFMDVQIFLPKVKKGGYIWFDDADWSTTTKAVVYLNDQCQLDLSRSVGTSCLLFKKI